VSTDDCVVYDLTENVWNFRFGTWRGRETGRVWCIGLSEFDAVIRYGGGTFSEVVPTTNRGRAQEESSMFAMEAQAI